MASTEGSDKSSVARQMLVDLKERLGRPLTTAEVIMEFTDRMQRGEQIGWEAVLVHVDGFLGDVPTEKRVALPRNLALAAALVVSGK